MSVTMESQIPAIIARATPKASAAVIKTVADIKARATGYAAVDTGTMKNSITGRKTGTLSGEVTVPVHYAVYVEYGTSKMMGQPFLSPAAEEVYPSFVAAMSACFGGVASTSLESASVFGGGAMDI